MKTFKDNQDREWTIAVTVASIKRVRQLTPAKVDLLKVVENELDLLAKLADDPILLVDTVYVLCKPEADQRGVTDEQFGEAMYGDALERAYVALLEDLCDFFRDARTRATMKKVVAKLGEASAAVLAEADRAADQLDIAELVKKWIASSGSSPAPSASTPDPSPSAKSS